jgi:N-acetylneuraminate lyase
MAIEGFAGIYPAIVSPKDDAGRADLRAFETLIGRLYDAGVHGLYVGGNTGEGYLLQADERKRLTETAVAASAGRGKVIVHVGAPAEDEAVSLAKHAAEQGADAISSLPPYVQGYSFEETYAYYAHLAYAADLPTFVYYIPAVTHREFTLDQVNRMLEIDGVAGLKFTNHNLYLMEGILHGGKDPHIFNGHDEVLLAGLVMGSHGGIGTFYNLLPKHFLGIYEAARKPDLAAGRRLQGEVNRLIRVCVRRNMLAAVFAILKWQGVDCGRPARPARPLDEAGERDLMEDLKAAGLLGALGIG